MQETVLNNFGTPLTVAVVGIGKMGLPLAVQYAQRGKQPESKRWYQ